MFILQAQHGILVQRRSFGIHTFHGLPILVRKDGSINRHLQQRLRRDLDVTSPACLSWSRPRPRWLSHQLCLSGRIQQVCKDNSSHGAVVTGGSRGFGFALAQELVAAGDSVVICGRDEARLAVATAALQRRAVAGAAVHSLRCDVSNGHDVAALGHFAAQRLGTVHLWFNNAGAVTSKSLLDETSVDEITDAVGTNVLGSLLCCREAIRVMRQQPVSDKPRYHVFNFGFSPWGRKLSATACTHKATKTALSALTEALSADLSAAGVTSIGVHNISPGMVLTDLLLKDTTAGSRRLFNALAEEPATVAASLTPRLRAIQGSNSSVEYLSPVSAVTRVVSRIPQIFGGGRFFDKAGNRVQQQGQQYASNGVRDPYQ